MKVRGSFVVDIKDYAKLKFEKTIQLTEPYNFYETLEEDFIQTVGYTYNNVSDILPLEVDSQGELNFIDDSMDIIEKYEDTDQDIIYTLVLGHDEHSSVEFVHPNKEVFYTHILSLLNEDIYNEMVVQRWKNGEKLDSTWIAGNR